MKKYIQDLQTVTLCDIAEVGGKNASLGEMIKNLSVLGVQVPGGFVTTAYAFQEFLQQAGLADRINSLLGKLNVDDVDALTAVGQTIRDWINDTPLSQALQDAIANAYQKMENGGTLSVAVRSSATAEDLPDASFAGQQETYLNVQGIENVLHAVKDVYASLYNNRAIAYRVHQGFAHSEVALSVGIQQMVRSDKGASGVMFTVDTESGFDNVVLITGAYGLGETVVQGSVNPDEFYLYKPALAAGRAAILRRNLGSKAIKMVYTEDHQHKSSTQIIEVDAAEREKFCLTDPQLEQLARQALLIEKHYKTAMDIEWALDGENQQFYIVQARPETVKSRNNGQVIERYVLKNRSEVLCEGRSIGARIGAGQVRIINDLAQMNQVNRGDVLVTDMTDPDWEPIMKRAAAIVTNRGGRTCHAAIIARELGIPAVVGCGDATNRLTNTKEVTVSCAEGDTGIIYHGQLAFEVLQNAAGSTPDLPVKLMMNVGNPERAFDFSRIPNAGVGLARLEFLINQTIGIHPRAILEFAQQPTRLQQEINRRSAAYADPVSFYVEKLVEGISTLAAAFHPQPVIVRTSDFKSNEYANLLGGDRYEPQEENPMIGFRGASRYLAQEFQACFELECRAIKYVRDTMGLNNLEVMIPFTRTVNEAKQVVELLASFGLQRGENGLRLIMMCEIPSNALLAKEFLQYFDGFSIGSNDLTQLTLGLDRDSGLIADMFDERDPAVKKLLHMAIKACNDEGKYIGICGQGPSDHPDFALWLLQEQISSISLNPDTVLETGLFLAKHYQANRSPSHKILESNTHTSQKPK
ncbi:MAG: phosphoenolpyruvate synthase [Thiohalomonadales bacterium]